MQRLGLLIGAFALWFLAIVGAVALAVWLRLSAQDTRLLLVVLAFIAFFGVFLPIAQLGKNRKP